MGEQKESNIEGLEKWVLCTSWSCINWEEKSCTSYERRETSQGGRRALSVILCIHGHVQLYACTAQTRGTTWHLYWLEDLYLDLYRGHVCEAETIISTLLNLPFHPCCCNGKEFANAISVFRRMIDSLSVVPLRSMYDMDMRLCFKGCILRTRSVRWPLFPMPLI